MSNNIQAMPKLFIAKIENMHTSMLPNDNNCRSFGLP